MVESGVFDEEETKILLIGNTAELEEGLSQVDQHLRRRICGRVRHYLPGLKSHDLADCWQETLMAVFKAVRDGRFDPDRPLGPYLFSIAHAKGIDLLRRQTTRDKALTAVGETLQGTQCGEEWRQLSSSERSEALAIVRDGIGTLPDKQRVVFQAFMDNYPETKDMEVLRQEVSRMTGREETLVSIKRALQEGRNKVRQLLERKGYTIGKRGDA